MASRQMFDIIDKDIEIGYTSWIYKLWVEMYSAF